MSLGSIVLKCELVKAGEPTTNMLIYSEEILEKAVASINTPIMGTVDVCPSYGRLSLDITSHQVDNIYINSNGKLTGNVEILDTKIGKKLKQLVDDGCELTLIPNFTASVGSGNVVNNDLSFNFINIGLTKDVKANKQY